MVLGNASAMPSSAKGCFVMQVMISNGNAKVGNASAMLANARAMLNDNNVMLMQC